MNTSRRKDLRDPVVGVSKPRLWKVLGPGLVTGAADDDPSGIATYSQAGAQCGFQLAWTLLLTYPLMVVIQAVSARLGRTTGMGIAGNLRAHFPRWLLHAIVIALFVANTLNIGADLGAMAEAGRLLTPAVPGWAFVVAFGLCCTLAQVFLKHTRYVSILKWLTLSLLAYFGTLCVIQLPWGELLGGLLLPHWSGRADFWLTVVAIFGTTISPYLFFWQAAQEVEDTKAKPREEPLRLAPAQAPRALARIQTDTLIGMGFSNLVALAILATAAATLHKAGIRDIASAAQAAEALRPLAGAFAFGLFALGIIGTGLLSIPVLAGSAAYALGEAHGWPVGFARKPMRAKAFYAAIGIATALGALGHIFAVNAVKALVWAAVLNGLVAVPVMMALMRLVTSRKVMGKFTISRGWAALGWIATATMALVAVAFVATLLRPAQ